MSEFGSARKRTREDENDTGTTPNVVRSPDFYSNDGTIALRALSKEYNTYTIFRVHKSLLALRCSVFRDMFGLEDAAHFDATFEQFDTVPLMHLHDGHKGLVGFLKALYYPEFMQRHLDRDQYYMREVSKMHSRAIRLAKKYGARTLLDIFARSLQKEWPSQLNLNFALHQSRVALQEVIKDEYIMVGYSDPVWTIRVAIDHVILDVLPSAFVTLNVFFSLGINAVEEDDEAIPRYDPNNLRVLNADELVCLFMGGRALTSYVYQYTSDLPTPPDTFSIPISNSHRCYVQVQAAWKRLRASLDNAHGSFRPFKSFMPVWVAMSSVTGAAKTYEFMFMKSKRACGKSVVISLGGDKMR